MKQQSSSIVTLALLLVAGGTTFKANAQTAADNFPLPTSVASGTKIQLDGSSSLQAVNQGLKDRFQKQFPGTDVTVPTQYQGSDSGVKAIAEDKADLAGIGRLLTKEEKAQGLAAKTIGRSKIAIIVNKNNPYTGNLTLKDFAKIYRGEVTDWSQLPSAKGAKGKIKVIDRPDSSDTRRAFANYPVFQNGKLKTGQNAEKLTEDSTKSVVDKLGDDGIGYAPADQIKDFPGIRAVTLHSTQPDNPKYPFSQPLAYAYKNKGGKVSDGAKAFLGYASDPAVQTAIASAAVAAGTEAATTSPATTAPEVTTTPPTGEVITPGSTTTTAPGTTTNTKGGGFPWWWIAPLLAIGGGLLWLFGRNKPTPDAPIAPVPDSTTGIKPLYPPQPQGRTPRGDGLSGDLSGDISSIGGGYRPSGDLRSGDLRSGDLSASLPSPPNINTTNVPNVPNINFNGVVDTVKTNVDGIGLAGGAAIAGGAAAAAALGNGIFDTAKGVEKPDEIRLPEIKAPDIDLSNPLEGLQDKSSNLIPNLEFNNPLAGIKDKVGDSIDGGGAAAAALGGAALAGGAAVAGGVGNLFGNDQDRPESSDLSLEVPNFEPVADIQAKVADSIPDVNLESNPGIFDNVGDFLQDGGGTVVAGGAAALAGGAALASGAGQSVTDLFGGTAEAAPEELWLDETGDIGNDPFNFGNPLDAIQDKAADLKDQSADLIPDLGNDPFDFGNPLDAVQDKAGELIPDLSEDPFDFDSLTGKAGDFLQGGGAAAVAAGGAAVAGGAALFGGDKKPDIAEFDLPNPEMDTFDRDLDAIGIDGFDEDPFAGLSDLLGEETGDISNEIPKPEASDFLSSLKDKASDLLADGKGLGGAALAGGAAATVGAGQAVQSFLQGKDAPASNRDDVAGTLYSEGQITLVSPSPTQAYAHWEIPVRLKRQLREQGGQKLVVRLYDVTNSGSNIDLPTTFQEFECNDSDWDLEIPITTSEHRYLAEIGYVTADGSWLMLARSAPLWIRENNG
jgi:ABC-type phosphate transport system substrate-binding protein